MNRINVSLACAAVAAFAALTGAAPAAGEVAVTGHTAGGGAVASGDGVFGARGTVGQAAAGRADNVQYEAGVGFWFLVPPPPLATGVEEADETVPGVFSLEANRPNPFNPSTTIPFSIPERGRVTLRLYDVSGREVATLLDREMEAGPHSLFFHPDRLASGVYFYRLTSGEETRSRRMLLIR